MKLQPCVNEFSRRETRFRTFLFRAVLAPEFRTSNCQIYCVNPMTQKSQSHDFYCVFLGSVALLRVGGAPRVLPFWGDTIGCFFVCFFLRPKTHWLVGKNLFFFGHHILSDWKPTRFAAKTFFFYLVFTYFLAHKGCLHEIPPPPPGCHHS